MRLRQSEFLSWLRSKAPDQVVGKPGSVCECPIANFHKDISGCEVVITDSCQGFRVDRGDGGRVAPVWAQRFMRDADEEQSPIVARRALEIVQATAP